VGLHVGLQLARKLEAPLILFQKLWEPLFTPAIGLLMAACRAQRGAGVGGSGEGGPADSGITEVKPGAAGAQTSNDTDLQNAPGRRPRA